MNTPQPPQTAPPVRVVISMNTNSCTIIKPESQVTEVQTVAVLPQQPVFVEETGVLPQKDQDEKVLVANRNKFQKKSKNYDRLVTHFSFK
jgi:hypothetical protein